MKSNYYILISYTIGYTFVTVSGIYILELYYIMIYSIVILSYIPKLIIHIAYDSIIKG